LTKEHGRLIYCKRKHVKKDGNMTM